MCAPAFLRRDRQTSPNNTDESAAWHECVETPLPDGIQFVQKTLIVSDVTQGRPMPRDLLGVL